MSEIYNVYILLYRSDLKISAKQIRPLFENIMVMCRIVYQMLLQIPENSDTE